MNYILPRQLELKKMITVLLDTLPNIKLCCRDLVFCMNPSSDVLSYLSFPLTNPHKDSLRVKFCKLWMNRSRLTIGPNKVSNVLSGSADQFNDFIADDYWAFCEIVVLIGLVDSVLDRLVEDNRSIEAWIDKLNHRRLCLKFKVLAVMSLCCSVICHAFQ